MAALIKLETGIEPQLVVGGLGEFAVRVNDRPVVKKGWIKLPPDERVVASVRDALAAAKVLED